MEHETKKARPSDDLRHLSEAIAGTTAHMDGAAVDKSNPRETHSNQTAMSEASSSSSHAEPTTIKLETIIADSVRLFRGSHWRGEQKLTLA
jgi:hypothetical protein